MTYTRFRQLWRNRPNLSTPITAEALNHIEDGLVGIDQDKSPGLKDWRAGTYRAGWPAIFAGSLYAARDTTTEPPIVGRPLAAPITNTSQWHHNATAGVAGDVARLVDNNIGGSASAFEYRSILEAATHTQLVGASVSAEVRIQDPAQNSWNRGFLIGVIDASKPTTTTALAGGNSTGSGFYGVQVSPVGFQSVHNGRADEVLVATGAGRFEWSMLALEFRDADAANLAISLTRDGADLARFLIPRPTFASYRLAFGVFSRAATDGAFVQMQGTPTLGQQSTHWRRLSAVADLT